jgi:hypothetical protein
MEPGRGYMIPILREKFPDAKIIALHIRQEETVPEEDAPDTNALGAAWSPESGVPLQRFLEREIPDTEASSIQIIEWRPSLSVYGEQYLRLLSETSDFIKRIDANKRTVRVFGRRWFKNFFKILSMARKVLCHHASAFASLPCIITGAGPGLEDSLPVIQDLKRRFPLFILGVSSAVPALRSGGIDPDLIITTDGGAWALFHLYECLRKDIPALAASLFSALPSQLGETPLLLISDGSVWQTLILQSLNIPFISLAQRGTVTASALDVAFTLTGGNVFISGMDLSHRDIRAHARPYSLDRFLEEKESRLNPVYSQTFVRSFGITNGGSHDVYAAWFKRQLETYPPRLYSLGTNHPVFDALTQWDAADWGKTKRPDRLFGSKAIPPRTNLAVQAKEILLRALQAPQTSAHIVRELGPLLFPDKGKVTSEALRDAISQSLG